MKHMILGAALAGAATIAIPAAAEPIPVGSVEVSTDIEAIGNEKAVARWQGLPGDLQEAILVRLTDQLDEDGARVEVDIDELSLADGVEMALGVEEAELRGEVLVQREFDASRGAAETDVTTDHYELTVTGEQAMVFYPEGTDVAVVTVGSDIFYHAMIAAFAANVAEKLE